MAYVWLGLLAFLTLLVRSKSPERRRPPQPLRRPLATPYLAHVHGIDPGSSLDLANLLASLTTLYHTRPRARRIASHDSSEQLADP